MQKTVLVEDAPIIVTWRESNPVEAEASGALPEDNPIKAAAIAIRSATGCAVPTQGVDFGRSIFFEADGNVRFTLEMDCTQQAAPAQALPETPVQSRENLILAAAVEEAVRAVVGTDPKPVEPRQVEAEPAEPEPVAGVGTPALYEGSPYAAFTPAMIQGFCAQTWTTRTAADGRTEYNPCTQRAAFR
ncbi:MAG: hypothetical protein AAGB15_02560 [Pseudomonadota bacterium]